MAFKDRMEEKGRWALTRAIEEARFNIHWMEERKGKVVEWIKNNNAAYNNKMSMK